MRESSPAYQSIKLPQLSLAAIRLNNLLLNKTAGFAFPLDPEGKIAVRVHLQPGNVSTQLLCPISLTLGLGNTTAGLWLSRWVHAEKIQQFVPEELLSKLPENLAINVVETAHSRLLQQAELALNMKIHVQSLSAETQSKQYSLPINFELQEFQIADQQPLSKTFGLLMLDEKLYPHLQERLRFWPSDNNLEWEDHITTLRFEISSLAISMQELNQLAPSDILLLEDTQFQETGRLHVWLNSGLHCAAAFTSTEKNALVINSDWTMPMTDQEQKPTIDHIAQIPVQLSFDLGQKTLSFNEVRQLRPGYVLELNSQLPEIVQIRSQNRILGQGELVEINGRLGVRILNLFGKQAKGSQ